MRLVGVLALVAVSVSGCQMSVPGAPEEALNAGAGAPAAQLAEAFAAASAGGEAPAPKGLFAFLKPETPPSPLADSDIEVVGTSDDASAAALRAQEDVPETASNPEVLVATSEVKTAGLGGMFGFLKPKHQAGAQSAALPQVVLPQDGGEFRPETHGVESEIAPEPAPVAPQKPLFGFLRPQEHQDSQGGGSTVQPGEVLPFGVVGVACDLRPGIMGRKVDQFPREGRAVWQLYDSDPESAAPRSQYITGFSDGCPRQVTAALVMFGEAALHEVLRYSGDTDRDWTRADKTYEKIKRQTCGVGRGERCPEDKLGALERQVAFVSVYPQYGAEEDWLELLLHNGALVSEEMR
ncbi:hypothetical protein CEW89_09755 [Celeribacter ethanolicus]|uniref:Uncharacterized protein n=1 Tax=Celeribacter ethanolicus TaxID=1758178 RepID=A0A291GBA9_9RHOB|nr:hypothetical protein [Celeribacter ethanolicus]ATG47823.1 hypothetical protein CEW89_09755 [Celeribacter ethanolicus]